MSTYVFDVPSWVTVRVEAADLAEAWTKLREKGSVTTPDVAEGVSRVSFGCELYGSYRLTRVDDERRFVEIPTHMQEPTICSSQISDNCEELYDGTNGDGWDGACPSCADKAARGGGGQA